MAMMGGAAVPGRPPFQPLLSYSLTRAKASRFCTAAKGWRTAIPQRAVAQPLARLPHGTDREDPLEGSWAGGSVGGIISCCIC